MTDTVRHILRFRGLLATLTARELKARYRGSVFGFVWSFINPLLLLGVYSFVFGVVFHPQRGGGTDPYALFLVTGLFPWVWVSSSLLEGSASLQANAGLIKKAVFPAELLPLVSVLANGAHFLLALPILGAALAVGALTGAAVGGWSVLLLPVVVLLELPLLAGMALALAALTAHFKDVRDILANLLTLGFFLTPVLYSIDAIPLRSLRLAVHFNPFTPFTLAYQEVLFFGCLPPGWRWLEMAGFALASWWLGSRLFDRLSETLVEAA